MTDQKHNTLMRAAAVAGVITLFVAIAQLWVAMGQSTPDGPAPGAANGGDPVGAVGAVGAVEAGQAATAAQPVEIGDRNTVGVWRLELGAQTWIQEFRENGTTTFRATGPNAPPDQEGTIRFTEGRWIANSRSIGYTDQGTYLMPDANTLIMVGEGGRAEWVRVR